VDSLSKKDAAKVHSVLLPLVAKAANDPAPEVREANMEVLVSFALKAANLGLLEKVCLCHSQATGPGTPMKLVFSCVAERSKASFGGASFTLMISFVRKWCKQGSLLSTVHFCVAGH